MLGSPPPSDPTGPLFDPLARTLALRVRFAPPPFPAPLPPTPTGCGGVGARLPSLCPPSSPFQDTWKGLPSLCPPPAISLLLQDYPPSAPLLPAQDYPLSAPLSVGARFPSLWPPGTTACISAPLVPLHARLPSLCPPLYHRLHPPQAHTACGGVGACQCVQAWVRVGEVWVRVGEVWVRTSSSTASRCTPQKLTAPPTSTPHKLTLRVPPPADEWPWKGRGAPQPTIQAR